MPNRKILAFCLFAAACGGSSPTPTPGGDDDPTSDAGDPGTPPIIELSPMGFFVDQATWWSDAADPTLTGSINAASMSSIEATIGGVAYRGTITGDTFSIPIVVDIAGGDVVVVATSATGEMAQATQKIRADLTPPELSATGSVRDESFDTISFPNDNGVPFHTHGGPAIDLRSSSCPAVNKYSYLLDATSNLEATSNPLAYALRAREDGVGLAGTIEMRVGRRDGLATTWLADWHDAGAPAVDGMDLTLATSLYRDANGAFATSAVYDIEVRTADRLGRSTTLAACVDLRMLAPPVWLGGFAERNRGYIAANHSLAMPSMKLEPGAVFDTIAGHLMNGATSTGASIFDMLVTNGTPDPAFLSVDLTAPTTASVSRRFVLRGHQSSTSVVSSACSTTSQANCLPPAFQRTTTEVVDNFPVEPITTRIRVFEWDFAAFTVGAELPLVSVANNRYHFVIPGNATGTPKTYTIMTYVDSLAALRPANVNYPEAGTMLDTSINGVRYSGKSYASVSGCTQVHYNPVSDLPDRCTERSTVIPFRALTNASVVMGASTMKYSVGPSADQAWLATTAQAPSGNYMNTMEGALPNFIPPSDPF